MARIEGALDHDQSVVGLMALDIAAGRRWPVFFDGQRYMGALEPYTPNDAEYKIRLQDEVGYGHVSTTRSLLNGSGRTDAWRGASKEARGA